MIELSVVMPARNVAFYIDEAIQSILSQSFADFELVICNDNSSDATLERLHYWAARDPRIRVFSSNHCNSPALAGNWAVSMARGTLIARMDGDDIAHPERLARQLAVLRRHPEAVLVGALFDGIDSASRPIYGRDRSSLFRKVFNAPSGHGVTMFRKAAFERVGGYRVACDYWEDFDLIYRMATIGRILYLPDALIQYRASTGHSRLRAQDVTVERAIDRRFACIDQFNAHGEYESVLANEDLSPRVRIRVFGTLAKIRITAGDRPRMLRRAGARGRPDGLLPTLIVLGVLVCGNIAPKALRRIMVLGIERRDRAAEGKVRDGDTVEWYWSKRLRDRQQLAAAEAANDKLPLAVAGQGH